MRRTPNEIPIKRIGNKGRSFLFSVLFDVSIDNETML
jgi:hypothetical protein